MRWLGKTFETTKLLKICYLFNINRFILRPYVDALKWRINSKFTVSVCVMHLNVLLPSGMSVYSLADVLSS